MIFITAKSNLGKCQSLGDQIRIKALRVGMGWETIREDLAKMAEEWYGREPVSTKSDFRAICREVFRVN